MQYHNLHRAISIYPSDKPINFSQMLMNAEKNRLFVKVSIFANRLSA